MLKEINNKWALILGASSGFGKACSLKLAQHGINIVGIHLDRKSTLPQVEQIKKEIQSFGKDSLFFNINVTDEEKRKETISYLKEKLGENSISILVHSVAFGTLKHYISEDENKMLNSKNIDMTLDVMAHSLVYWTQELVKNKLMGKGGRIFALTSAGSHRVWPTYGAVSAAKAALEAHIRQLAVELAPYKITANALRAGVTDTPALRKIPGHEALIENALKVNPYGRLTTPEDVANAIILLSHPYSSWITGNVIGVDGGEDLI